MNLSATVDVRIQKPKKKVNHRYNHYENDDNRKYCILKHFYFPNPTSRPTIDWLSLVIWNGSRARQSEL